MAIGNKVKEYQEKKAARKKRDKLKKFPAMALSNRPMLEKRQGAITPEEKATIELLLRDQPQELSSEQIAALSSLLRRNVKTVENLVLQARSKFTANGERYVETHLRATQAALVAGEYDTAAKHAEWAMENLEMEGTRLIDREQKVVASTTPTVMIGVALGGVPNGKIVGE